MTKRLGDRMEELKLLKEQVQNYEQTLQDIYDICLCERFKTEGFDYHEQHPRRKDNNGGSRPKTPRDLIESRIGFEWEYEKPEGVCNSWKVLKFKALESLKTLIGPSE